MEGKQSGDDGAPPDRAGHPFEQKENQDRVDDMQQHIHQMVRAGLLTEPLAIQHVREPGHRMPIRFFAVEIAKCPRHALRGQSFLNDAVSGDVIRIVVIDEFVLADLPIDRARHHGQKQNDEQITAHVAPAENCEFTEAPQLKRKCWPPLD